jgi:hypothetical protein
VFTIINFKRLWGYLQLFLHRPELRSPDRLLAWYSIQPPGNK